MSDLDRFFVGSTRDEDRIHRASPISTWAGQNLDARVTRPLRYRDCKMNDTKSHSGEDSWYRRRDNGDGSRRPSWRALVFRDEYLYRNEVALKPPLKLRNPSTTILGYDAILVQ